MYFAAHCFAVEIYWVRYATFFLYFYINLLSLIFSSKTNVNVHRCG